jgi:hypothetical protein
MVNGAVQQDYSSTAFLPGTRSQLRCQPWESPRSTTCASASRSASGAAPDRPLRVAAATRPIQHARSGSRQRRAPTSRSSAAASRSPATRRWHSAPGSFAPAGQRGSFAIARGVWRRLLPHNHALRLCRAARVAGCRHRDGVHNRDRVAGCLTSRLRAPMKRDAGHIATKLRISSGSAWR